MEPIDFWGALRRSWRLLLVLGVVGAVLGIVIPAGHPKKHAPPLYPYSASVVVGGAPTGGTSGLGAGVSNGQIEFYAASTSVTTATLQAANLDILPVYASTVLSSRPDGVLTKRGKQTVPVLLTASSTTPVGAIALANTYETQLADFLVTLVTGHQSQKASSANAPSPTASSIGFQVLQPAVLSSTADKRGAKSSLTSSRKVRLLAGLVIGMLLGAAIVLARELLDKRLRSADRAESTFGYPVVVEIPGSSKSAGDSSRGLAVVDAPESPGAEAYRMLRMSVLFESLAARNAPDNSLDFLVGSGLLGGDSSPLAKGRGPSPAPVAHDDADQPESLGRRQVVLVVSPGSEKTRSQVVANFAATYAEAGQRAVVISTAELGNGPLGIATGAVSGEVAPEDVEARLEPSAVELVYFLPLADFVVNSAQLVTRAPAVIDAARSVADVIVVEAPPLLVAHHGEALSRAVDVVLVVGECWTTTFDDARRAGDALRRMEAPVLGVVLTGTRPSRRDARHAVGAVTREVPAAESALDPASVLVDEYSVAGASTQTET